MQTRWRAVAWSALMVLSACSESSLPSDSGTPGDAGPARGDGGTTARDAGGTTRDGDIPFGDGGATFGDGGGTRGDGGVTRGDGGTTARGTLTLGAGTAWPEIGFVRAVASGDLDGDGRLDLIAATTGGANGDAIVVLLGQPGRSFAAAVRYPLGGAPDDVTLADSDGDGKLDVLTDVAGQVELLHDRGGGALDAPVALGGQTSGDRLLAAGDLDGDGRLDLVTANLDGAYVQLAQASGYATPVAYASREIRSLVPADLDGDGRLDLVLGAIDPNTAGARARVLRNQGDGSFVATGDYATGWNPIDVGATVADLDRDGRPDVVIAGDAVCVLLGTGGATLGAPSCGTSLQAGSVRVGDLDGDGTLDAVAGADAIDVLRGLGGGRLGAAVATSATPTPAVAAVADFDRDGHLDVLARDRNSGVLAIVWGEAGGALDGPALWPAHDAPSAVALGDLDGDGDLDVAVANEQSGDVSVLLNHGDGSFASAIDYTATPSPSDVAIADLDGDGRPDLIVAGSDYVTVLHNTGGGTFFDQPASTYVGGTSAALAAGDLDRDGRIDVAVAVHSLTAGVVVLRNVGGALADAAMYGAAGYEYAIALGDVSGDGALDVAVADDQSNLSVLLNHGDGTLGISVNYPDGAPRSLAMSDLDGDGRLDIAVDDDAGVSLLLNNGNGTFSRGPRFATAGGAGALRLADLDDDGRLDAVVSSQLAGGSGVLGVLRNLGGGSFGAPREYVTMDSSAGLFAVGDLDGDGLRDVVLPASSGVLVLRNRSF